MGDEMWQGDAEGKRLLAQQLKALGHPARLRVLEILAGRGSCVCGEIVEVMPLAQATVSQHLKVLKEAGLIRGTIDGPRSCYCLDPTAVRELKARVGRLLARLERGADNAATATSGKSDR